MQKMKIKANKKKIIRIVIIILLLIFFNKNYYNIVPHIPLIPIFWFEKQEDWSLKFVRYERFWEGLNFLYFLDPDFIWRKDENWQLTWKCREFAWGKISNIWYYKDWKKEWKWIWYYKNWKISNVWYYKNWLENWEFIYYYVNWKNISTIIKYDNWKVLEEIHYYTWGQIKSIINMENWLESTYYNEDWTVKDSFWGNKIFFQIENWEKFWIWTGYYEDWNINYSYDYDSWEFIYNSENYNISDLEKEDFIDLLMKEIYSE